VASHFLTFAIELVAETGLVSGGYPQDRTLVIVLENMEPEMEGVTEPDLKAEPMNDWNGLPQVSNRPLRCTSARQGEPLFETQVRSRPNHFVMSRRSLAQVFTPFQPFFRSHSRDSSE
jgi:hypothetical protein